MTAPRLPPLPPMAPGARLWVAYSGGADSSALLQLLWEARVPNLRAVHVHHGLQATAEDWVRHCEGRCAALNVPLTVLRVQVDPDHEEGPEGAARAARYAALRGLLAPGDILATAHHQDDQAETVLLRLLRGSGVDGLSAMPQCTPFPPGLLWRPLLHVGRASLRRYVEVRGLTTVDDPHNDDPRYARSWLRREVMPRLHPHWPQATRSLARFAQHASTARDLLADLAQLDLGAMRAGSGLSVNGLLALTDARRHNLLRYWLQALGAPAPAQAVLPRIDQELLSAREDAQPRLLLGSWELRRYRDRLYAMRPLPPAPEGPLPWPATLESITLPSECGILARRSGPRIPLEIRFVRGGERLRPENQAHHRRLKNLFQEAAVPPWVRERTPLIYQGNELLAVANFWRSAQAASLGLDLDWTHDLTGLDGHGD